MSKKARKRYHATYDKPFWSSGIGTASSTPAAASPMSTRLPRLPLPVRKQTQRAFTGQSQGFVEFFLGNFTGLTFIGRSVAITQPQSLKTVFLFVNDRSSIAVPQVKAGSDDQLGSSGIPKCPSAPDIAHHKLDVSSTGAGARQIHLSGGGESRNGDLF